MIYTIGYQRLAPIQLRDVVHALDAILIDVRRTPRTRIAGFGPRQLDTLLGERYIWKGDILGGRVERLQGTALDWLEAQGRDRNVVTMCVCHEPGHCHRHVLMHEALPDMMHIFEDHVVRAGELARMMAEPGDEYGDYEADDLPEGVAAALGVAL